VLQQPSKLDKAYRRYQFAAERAKAAADAHLKLVPAEEETLVGATAELLFASGDLAVSAIEAYVRTARWQTRATILLTLVIALATGSGTWATYRAFQRPPAPPIVNFSPAAPVVNVSPPVVNISPPAVNVYPTINVPPPVPVSPKGKRAP